MPLDAKLRLVAVTATMVVMVLLWGMATMEAMAVSTRKVQPGDRPLLGAPPSYWIDLRDYDPARDASTLKQPLLLLQGGREAGAALLSQEIDGLLFTGSAAAGDHFRRQFVDRPEVILALELGGNNPLVVWDAEPETAAQHIVQSAFVTTGQRCSCARRLILPAGKAGDAILEATVALAARLVAGPFDGTVEPYMGPLISARAAQAARVRFTALAERGGRVIRPLAQIDGLSEAFVTPAIIDVDGVDGLEDEEIFAPALQVRRAADFDEALRLANDTAYGLSAGLIGGDEALWTRFLRRIRAGVGGTLCF
jgi:succinylglutamic semialdehyde dehydrogenase